MRGSCILHVGTKSPAGYGYLWSGSPARRVFAHRKAYADANGLDPHTMAGVVMHACDNPGCINPKHLSLGSQADNIRDMYAKGRNVNLSGARGSGAVLTDGDVEFIRQMYVSHCRTNGSAALSRLFGVAQSTISRVVNNKSFKPQEAVCEVK